MDKVFEKFYSFLEKFIKSEKVMAFIRKFFSREIIMYLVFGVLTTVVNLIFYHICNKVMNVLISNVIAWIAAVIFAFITNKLFVFDSKSWSPKVIAKEIPSFTAARLITLGIEEAGLAIMITWLHLDEILTLPFADVVVLNYVFSKLIIFKKKA